MMMGRSILMFATVISLVLLPSCVSRPGATEYNEITRNAGEGNSAIIERFDSYPINKQIDVFLYSEDPRFEAILALNGKSKISQIVSRIEDQNTAFYEKWRLIRVLHRIHNDCQCVNNDRNIMLRLERLSASSSETSKDTEHYRILYLKDVEHLRDL